MRTVAIVVVLGCESASVQPSPTAPPIGEPLAVIADAAPGDASGPIAVAPPRAPIDAATIVVAPAVPPDLAATPVWIFRHFETGAVQVTHPLTTYRLHHDHARAAMIVERREAHQSAIGVRRIDGFVLRSAELYVGTVATHGKELAFDLASGGSKLAFSCKPKRLAVATSGAARERTPGIGGCEGDRGRWRPRTTTRVDVLSCWPFGKDDLDPDREERLAFAPAPGIEFLYVNDDCVIQGGGYRKIAADGSVGDIRDKPGP